MTSDVLNSTMSSRRIPVRISVDEALWARYELRYGGYASMSWLLENAMTAVLDSETPDIETIVRESIHAHIMKHNNKTRGQNVQPAGA